MKPTAIPIIFEIILVNLNEFKSVILVLNLIKDFGHLVIINLFGVIFIHFVEIVLCYEVDYILSEFGHFIFPFLAKDLICFPFCLQVYYIK